MSNKKTAAVIILAAAAMLTGCAKFERADPRNGYSTQTAMSAIEYQNYIDKEIGVVMNQLFTRITMADQVAEGTYEREKELENAQESLTKIQECKDMITTTMPAQGYESARQSVLDLMGDAVDAVQTYVDDLSGGSADSIHTDLVTMQGCYSALGGEANNWYQ